MIGVAAVKQRFLSSLRGRLLALIILALLPAFVLLVYKDIEDNRRSTAEVKKVASQVLHLSSQAQQELINDAHDLLTLVSQLPRVLLEPSSCRELLTKLSAKHENFGSFLVVNASADVICSSLPGFAGGNYADRRWFREAIKSRRFAAGEYMIGRVTRRPIIVFAAPVSEGDTVKGVVSVAVFLDWLNRLSKLAQLPAGSNFTILDRNGTVLAHQPDSEKWIGERYPDPQVLRVVQTTQGEGSVERTGPDGVERLFAFRPLAAPDHGLYGYLVVGIPRETAYQTARAAFFVNLICFISAAILVLAIAWWGSKTLVLNPIRSLADASARLGKGDLSARTGIARREDEIGRLASAFDGMAEALQAREADRRRAEEMRARLAAIVESSSDAIIGRSLDGKVTSWNKGAERLFGYSAEEMIGKEARLLVPPDQVERSKANYVRINRGERIDSFETVRLKKDGAPVDVSVTVSPVIDDAGRVIGASSIVRDITQARRAQSELRALHEINRAITSSLDLRVILNLLLEKIEVLLPYGASHIRLFDKATGRLEPVASRNLDEEQWKAGSEPFQRSVHATILQTRRPLIIRDLRRDERVRRRDFYRRQGLVSFLGAPLLVQGKVIGVLSLLTRDEHEFSADEIQFAETVAEQASIAIHNAQLYQESQKLAEQLAAREKRISALASGLIRARDEEARRIASVLHDESRQFLAMVYISLDEISVDLSENGKRRVAAAKALLDEVENRLRDLSHELHPATLDHLGLIPSIEHLASQTAKRAAIEITVEGQLDQRLSPHLELTIYRVVQEALNNVVRHAGAKAVQIRLQQDENWIQCAVQDDGVGFDPGAEAARKGLGLSRMRERVHAAGGTFEVISAPGHGSKIFLSLRRERADVSANSSS